MQGKLLGNCAQLIMQENHTNHNNALKLTIATK